MFYKLIDEHLHYGPYVMFPDGTILHKDITDLSTLPYDDWYYFETEEEAKTFFNIE
jgi:hypothetical protein